jgi:hypothetical protein
MDNTKIKSDVLQELIDLMESKEVDGLKSKSPKFSKFEQETPEMPEESEELKEEWQSDPSIAMDETDKPKESEDDLKRLLEMYQSLK